jgi:hypothetical protein
MSGDILKKLQSSDAAESLRMESFIADCFRSHKWPAEQGIYFTDPMTGKAREIDVISRHFLDRPLRRKGIGGPVINLSIICECKSLAGWNVLLLKGGFNPIYENKVMDHWAGHDEHLHKLVEEISEHPAYRNSNKNALYSYYVRRAHPDETQLNFHMRLLQPPVDLIATAFRATKNGADERETINPLWSAIQSSLSATEAARIRAVDTMKSYTTDFGPHSGKAADIIRQNAFFFDSELTRRVFFHPVVFCKSRLFQIDQDMNEVKSARIFVRDLDFKFKYVDLVNFDGATDYIDAMLRDFEKQSRKSIRKMWDRMEDLQWHPGQASNKLAQALGQSRRPRAKAKSQRSPNKARPTVGRLSKA